MPLKLKLFGRPALTLESENKNESKKRLPAFSNKALGLVYYLAVTQQPTSREALAGLLWSDANNERARRNLRVELSKLRPHLGPYLDIQRNHIAIDTLSNIWIDVGRFEDNLNRPEPTVAQIEEAVGLYDGDFLADFNLRGSEIFEEWQLVQRERLRQMAMDGLYKLVIFYTAEKRYDAGISAVRRLLALEPWLEEAHRQLMHLLAQNGQRSAALAQYEICRKVLDEELGVEPSSETAELHMQLLNDEIEVDSGPTITITSEPAEPDPVPFQPPPSNQNFVGRTSEIEQLTHQIKERTGVIGLVGMGGIGKTTLATQLSHNLKPNFADGVLWADAAHSEPLDILQSWGEAYGYDFSGIGDVKNKAAAVRGMLADKKSLIILDDVVQVSRIRPLLAGGEQCVTVLTTRNLDVANGLEAAVLPIGELEQSEGVALLKEILGDERVEAELEAAIEICEQLDNYPLALEITAKRLKSRQRRKLADMANRLADMQQRLGLEISDHAVRASFEVSWLTLDVAQTEVFRSLAAFEGLSFTVEALAAVIGVDHYAAEDHLFSLVALSLLKEEGEVHFRLHPLLADFAEEKLAGDPTKHQSALRQMALYYQQFAAENKENYPQLRTAWGNFMAGIRTANVQEEWQLLLDYVEVLDEPWFRQARFDEMRTALGLAKVAAEKLEDQKALAQILHRSGEAAFEQDEFELAKDNFENSLVISLRFEDGLGIARSQYRLARVFHEMSNYEKALNLFEQTEKIFFELNDTTGLSNVFLGKAYVYEIYGSNAELAYDYAIRAHNYQQDLPVTSSTLETLRLLSSIYYAKKEFEKALTYSQNALRISKELEDIGEYAAILYLLSAINRQTGLPERASEYAKESCHIFKKLGSLKWQGAAELELGISLGMTGDWASAIAWCRKSLNHFTQIQYQSGQAEVHFELAKIYSASGNQKQKAKAYNQALEIAQRLNYQGLVNRLNKLV